MFTTPCFIRKNTPEIRYKLSELGYTYSNCDNLNLDYIITFPSKGMYSIFADYHFKNEYFEKIWKIKYIDCGDNEELFVALAALRDDNDYMQWFTDGKLWEKSNNDLPSRYMQLEGHKATINEIIEHFKDK